MKVVVLSDTHRMFRNAVKIVEDHLDADMFIHLGDGESDYQQILSLYPDLASKFYYVKGNCDYENAPISQTIDVMPGHRIFATHGHRFHARSTTVYMEQLARESGCDILLYGHTHIAQCAYHGGLYVINPGSASSPRDEKPPSYALLDITSAGVMPNFIYLV